MNMRYINIMMAIIMASATFVACDDDDSETAEIKTSESGETIISLDGRALGWLQTKEDLNAIEDEIMLFPGAGSSMENTTTLPSSVDLTKYLPPIGDQGAYGTCCVWATGYYNRTWHYAKNHGWSKEDMNSQSKLFSPAYLWNAIDNGNKGDGCGGTYFEACLDVMQSKGISTLDVSPYSKICCSCSPTSSANSNAASYKIKGYRELKLDVNTIKRALAEGRVVMFGAMLDDSFMFLNNNSVLTTATTYNSTGMHAYHAMLCVGYDDSKNAFRIVNSWGNGWGDNGFGWIGYDYFVGGKFAYAAFTMTDNDEVDFFGNETSSDVEEVKGNTNVAVTMCRDIDYNDESDPDSQDPAWRTLVYDVTNQGDVTVPASKNWSICYLAYNAYNANEFSVVLCDVYSDQIGSVAKNTSNNDWSEEEAKQILGFDASGFAISNIDIPAGASVANTVSTLLYKQEAKSFKWTYRLPENMNGKYYLVLMADAFGALNEANTNDNQFFVCTADNSPLEIKNGVIQNNNLTNKAMKIRDVMTDEELNQHRSAVCDGHLNTYTPEEITKMVQYHYQNGMITNKALEYIKDAKASKTRSFVK